MYNSIKFRLLLIISTTLFITTFVLIQICYSNSINYTTTPNIRHSAYDVNDLMDSYTDFDTNKFNLNLLAQYKEPNYFKNIFNEYKKFYKIDNQTFISKIDLSRSHAIPKKRNEELNEEEKTFPEFLNVKYTCISNSNFFSDNIEMVLSLIKYGYSQLPDKSINLENKNLLAQNPQILIKCTDKFKEYYLNTSPDKFSTLTNSEIAQFITSPITGKELKNLISYHIEKKDYDKIAPINIYYIFENSSFTNIDIDNYKIATYSYIIIINTSNPYKLNDYRNNHIIISK